MGTALFKEVNYTLSLLVEQIDIGTIGLPDIQRPFIWPNSKVRNLLDSMYKGFPIGYLLLWANGFSDNHKTIGEGVKQKYPQLLIVDGQQRLTSLYTIYKGLSVLRNNFNSERIFIAFRPTDGNFEVADAAIRKNPEYIDDISIIWSKKIDIFQVTDEYLTRLKNSREVSREEEVKIKTAIIKLQGLKDYPFSALELSSNIDEENVAEIFVRINSQGATLNQSDFILTLMSVFWEDGRKQLEEFSRNSRIPSTSGASPFNYFIQPEPDQLLRVSVGIAFKRARLKYVYSILRGKDLETEQFSEELREKQFVLLKVAQSKVLDLTNWHEFLKCLIAAGYKGKNFISSQTAVVYCYVFYLIGKTEFNISASSLRKIISRWFFMISLTGRYSSSPESAMEQDLAKLREINNENDYINALQKIIDENLTNDYWNITLPGQLSTSAARGPSLFAYYASLNILDAKGLFSNIKISDLLDPSISSKKSALEKHHLFPRAYLKDKLFKKQTEINQIANYALVEWSDNIDISDQPPKEYVPTYEQKFAKDALDKMYYWHCLPEKWYELEYSDFLQERRKRIAQLIKTGFEKL